MSKAKRKVVIVEIGVSPPVRLDKALAHFIPERIGMSRSRLTRLIRGGNVSLNGIVETSADARAKPGQRWRLEYSDERTATPAPEPIELDVVFEDADLIVVNKPAGLVVHPGAGNADGTLVNALLYHCGELSGVRGGTHAGIVHRIDKDTSGLVVAAKTDRAHLGLSSQFAAHAIDRVYIAVVFGFPGLGDSAHRHRPFLKIASEAGKVVRVEGDIGRSRRDRTRMSVVARGKRAVTRFEAVEAFRAQTASLLKCWLETGRTHQIRVHLSHCGLPLIGDRVYGHRANRRRTRSGVFLGPVIRNFSRQALHATSLGFRHPVTMERMHFDSPLPPDMASLVRELRGGSPETPDEG